MVTERVIPLIIFFAFDLVCRGKFLSVNKVNVLVFEKMVKDLICLRESNEYLSFLSDRVVSFPFLGFDC